MLRARNMLDMLLVVLWLLLWVMLEMLRLLLLLLLQEHRMLWVLSSMLRMMAVLLLSVLRVQVLLLLWLLCILESIVLLGMDHDIGRHLIWATLLHVQRQIRRGVLHGLVRGRRRVHGALDGRVLHLGGHRLRLGRDG